jgi:probable phosphoglycerate mutase
VNHLIKFKRLQNRYFAFRHGKSEANILGLIVSNPKIGIKAYGLSETGKKQVLKSLKKYKSLLGGKTLIITSDFKRARETALLAQKFLKTTSPQVAKQLRERYFGDFDQTPHSNYRKFWSMDNRGENKWQIESLDSVVNRTSKLITILEKKYKNKTILLVAHGDPLQILQTAFLKIPAKKHRSLGKLETGEIRELKLA